MTISDKQNELSVTGPQLLPKAAGAPGLGTFFINVGTETVSPDQHAAGLFGLADDAPLPLSQWFECIHPDDRTDVVAAFESTCETGQPIESECRILNDVTSRWLRCRMLRQTDGAGTAVEGVAVDLTGHHQALQGISIREACLRQAIEAAPLPVIIHAEDGRILYVSETLLELTGYRRDQLKTVWEWLQLAYGARAPQLQEFIRGRYGLTKPTDSGEHVVMTAARDTRLWRFRTSPIGRDANGVRMVVSMATDMTEQREREERMQLFMREVNHRGKNVLAKVQAILRISQKMDPDHFVDDLESRIISLARVHTLIDVTRASLQLVELLESEMTALALQEQWSIEGPDVLLTDPEVVQSMGMLVQELITNSVKYGALRDSDNRVHIAWSVDDDRFHFCWREFLTETIDTPQSCGFGTFLFDMIVQQLQGSIGKTWHRDGLECRITLPARHFAPVSSD